MIRRNTQTHSRIQHFRFFEINKEQAYIFWEDNQSKMHTFYINADRNKYFQLKREGKWLIQEWVWSSYQTIGYQNYIFSAKQMFENDDEAFQNDDDEKEKKFLEEQQTTANTTPRKSISENEFDGSSEKWNKKKLENMDIEKFLKIQNENQEKYERIENIDIENYLKIKNEKEEKENRLQEKYERELQEKEKYERELQQYLLLRKVLLPIIFDEEKDFSDEEEKEFSKLYENILNDDTILNDDRDTVEGFHYIRFY